MTSRKHHFLGTTGQFDMRTHSECDRFHKTCAKKKKKQHGGGRLTESPNTS